MGEREATSLDPRVRRSRDKILAAVREELTDRGYEGLTIEGVAERAGVGKATIYRHWDDRAELVIDAAGHLRSSDDVPRHGTTAQRLIRLYESLAQRLWDPDWSRHVPSLLDAAGRDTRVATLFAAFIAGRRGPSLDALQDGVAAGEVPPDTDLDATIDQLAGPLFYRRFFSGRAVRAGEVADLVARVLADPPRR